MLGLAPISLKRLVDSSAEPLSLAAAKEHLRVVDFADDDDYITALITQARHTIEEATRRALWTGQTWQAAYPSFGSFGTVRGRLSIPRPPLIEVAAVQYYDNLNTLQTVPDSQYITDSSGNGRAVLGFSSAFGTPLLSCDYAAPVLVTFTAGYANAAAFPGTLLAALKYLIQHFYDNRGPVAVGVSVQGMPLTYQYLLNLHTVPNRC